MFTHIPLLEEVPLEGPVGQLQLDDGDAEDGDIEAAHGLAGIRGKEVVAPRHDGLAHAGLDRRLLVDD